MTRKKMKRDRKERGYTLLEYCAGAALIAGIIWVSLNAMGAELGSFLDSIGLWIQRRGQGISQ